MARGEVSENGLYDLVIVGGGPAGLSAALYAMRAALNTVLVERSSPGGQVAITKGVENYPGFQDIPGVELAERFLKHAKSYGLPVIKQEVMGIKPGFGSDGHAVRLADGRELHAHAVILAAGGTTRRLDVPGEVEYLGRGVSYCATCDGFFFRDRPVVVVGGGDTALEDSLYLSKLASKVHLVHRRDTFKGSKVLQKRVFEESGIELILETIVTTIQGDSQEMTGVRLRNVKTGREWDLQAEGIFIFVGYTPNSRLVPEGVKMNEKGYVKTDDKCGTDIPGIYVIGDLRQKFANQIVIAAADGCIAALAAAQYVDAKKSGIDLKDMPDVAV